MHIVTSTKHREPLLRGDIHPRLFAYMGGIARNQESMLVAAGGVEDHVHLLVDVSKNIAVSELVMHLKKDSSKWLKTVGPEYDGFHWQDGYSGFSIGESGVGGVRKYLEGQREHHRGRSFQDELREFFNKYQMGYDERYVWD